MCPMAKIGNQKETVVGCIHKHLMGRGTTKDLSAAYRSPANKTIASELNQYLCRVPA
jgi:hypothetical protein